MDLFSWIAVSLNLWKTTYLKSSHHLFWACISGTFCGASIIAVLEEELNPLSKTRWRTGAWGNQYHSPLQRVLCSGTQANRKRRMDHPGTGPKWERPERAALHFPPCQRSWLFFVLHRWLRADCLNSRFALQSHSSPAKNKKIIVSLISE